MTNILKFTSLLALSSFMMISCGDSQPSPSEEPTLNSISLSGDYPTVFFVNDTFTYAGLVVTANYSDNTFKEVTNYTVLTPDLSTLGSKDVIVTYLTQEAHYSISVIPEEPEEYDGYIHLDTFYEEIDIAKNPKKIIYLNPSVYYDGQMDVTKTTFHCLSDDSTLAKVSEYSGVIRPLSDDGYQLTGTLTITITCEEAPLLTAKCVIVFARNIPEATKEWNRVDNYDSLKDGDVLVMAAPQYGLTASLDTLHSKLNPVESTFSSDYKKITSLGTDSIELVLEIEGPEKMTLEAQTGEYLICTHQGKVKLDSGKNTNKYWDIHANYNIEDGAVIENEVESLGYMMFNVSLRYFTTYIDNSISEYMKLPVLYRLE